MEFYANYLAINLFLICEEVDRLSSKEFYNATMCSNNKKSSILSRDRCESISLSVLFANYVSISFLKTSVRRFNKCPSSFYIFLFFTSYHCLVVLFSSDRA